MIRAARLPLAIVLVACTARAQTEAPPHPSETMVVLGSPTPVPLAESPASVLILPVKEQELKVGTPVDLLREDSSIFIEQRGAGGAQADIVLRGGSFEQTLVLVNGLRIDDAQTSHHDLDLPIPMEAMDQIQVLHGAGSTLHGVDALDGVVDFMTAAPSKGSVLLRAGGGSFGENEESLMAGGVWGHKSGRITADRNFSAGFMTDRDYRNEDASAEAWLGSRLGVTDLLLAGSDRAFGANQFYGPYPEWERTKGLFASIRQEIGLRTEAAFGFRRHTDEFVLIRDDPSAYENNHIDGSWQSQLRHTVSLPQNSLLLMGVEADGDSIRSNNLGIHARNRGAGYLDFDLSPPKRRWNLSAGLREEVFSGGGGQWVTSPHAAGSWRVRPSLKLRATGGYGFRIPTYTDLYYSDPVTIGNPNLKPESAWSGEAGFDWAAGRKFMLSATGFYSRQHNAIDYVRANSNAPWQAVNLSGLRFTGVEASTTWKPTRAHTIQVGWTSLYGAQNALHGLQSEYLFNYPVNNVHTMWDWALPGGVVLTNMVQIAQRYQQTAYPVWDVSLMRGRGRMQPYARLTNASNTGYQEIAGVAMPGRAMVAGLAIRLGVR